MSFSQRIINLIHLRRDFYKKNQPGAIGQFWRDGGNQLLYELPVKTGGLVIDAGGYQGEWSIGMVSRYGCRCQIFEPVPEFFEHCETYFENNQQVQVHKSALGGTNRKSIFSLLDNGTSEYRVVNSSQCINVDVTDVADLFQKLDERVACLKLNIEGGEYEVLERLIETNHISRCDSLLIQFHQQPEGYELRYKSIISALQSTHTLDWSYKMVWEKWVCKSIL